MSTETDAKKARKRTNTPFHRMTSLYIGNGSRRRFFRVGGVSLATWTLGSTQASANEEDPTEFQITSCESDGSIPDNHIWINGVLTNVSTPITLTDGSMISCYDPNGSSNESVVTNFEIESTDPGANPNEPEIDYDVDGFEIDLSILDSFEENYDPDAGTPGEPAYTIEDPNGGSIGING